MSSKQKGNVLPGVAIATALMPPLCTAGFGLATGNFYYFFGAFYCFSSIGFYCVRNDFGREVNEIFEEGVCGR